MLTCERHARPQPLRGRLAYLPSRLARTGRHRLLKPRMKRTQFIRTENRQLAVPLGTQPADRPRGTRPGLTVSSTNVGGDSAGSSSGKNSGRMSCSKITSGAVAATLWSSRCAFDRPDAIAISDKEGINCFPIEAVHLTSVGPNRQQLTSRVRSVGAFLSSYLQQPGDEMCRRLPHHLERNCVADSPCRRMRQCALPRQQCSDPPEKVVQAISGYGP